MEEGFLAAEHMDGVNFIGISDEEQVAIVNEALEMKKRLKYIQPKKIPSLKYLAAKSIVNNCHRHCLPGNQLNRLPNVLVMFLLRRIELEPHLWQKHWNFYLHLLTEYIHEFNIKNIYFVKLASEGQVKNMETIYFKRALRHCKWIKTAIVGRLNLGLGQLSKWTKLTKLSLESPLTDESIAVLQKACPKLQVLECLADTTGFTDKGVETLAAWTDLHALIINNVEKLTFPLTYMIGRKGSLKLFQSNLSLDWDIFIRLLATLFPQKQLFVDSFNQLQTSQLTSPKFRWPPGLKTRFITWTVESPLGPGWERRMKDFPGCTSTAIEFSREVDQEHFIDFLRAVCRETECLRITSKNAAFRTLTLECSLQQLLEACPKLECLEVYGRFRSLGDVSEDMVKKFIKCKVFFQDVGCLNEEKRFCKTLISGAKDLAILSVTDATWQLIYDELMDEDSQCLRKLRRVDILLLPMNVYNANRTIKMTVGMLRKLPFLVSIHTTLGRPLPEKLQWIIPLCNACRVYFRSTGL